MQREVRRRRSGFVQGFAALALMAMVARALLPAGFMLAPAGHGGFIGLTLCSGQGAATAYIDLRTGAIVDGDKAPAPSSPAKSGSDGTPCLFASVVMLAAPEASPKMIVAARPSQTMAAAIVRSTPGHGLAAPPPWATGPPLAA